MGGRCETRGQSHCGVRLAEEHGEGELLGQRSLRRTSTGDQRKLHGGGVSEGENVRRSDKSGILSVYETPTCLNTEKTEGVYRAIRPLKCFKNLVTEIHSVAINNDNTLVVYASEEKKDQVRVIHLPSLSVYSNWPAVNEQLGFIRDVSISGDNRACGGRE